MMKRNEEDEISPHQENSISGDCDGDGIHEAYGDDEENDEENEEGDVDEEDDEEDEEHGDDEEVSPHQENGISPISDRTHPPSLRSGCTARPGTERSR